MYIHTYVCTYGAICYVRICTCAAPTCEYQTFERPSSLKCCPDKQLAAASSECSLEREGWRVPSGGA